MKHLQSKKRIFGWSTTTTTTKVHLNVYNLGHSYGWMTLNKYFISFCFVRFFCCSSSSVLDKDKICIFMCMCFTPLFFICTETDTLNCGHTHIAIFVPAARPTHFYTKVGTEKRTSWTAPKNCNHNMQTTALRIHTNLISLSDLLCQFTNFRRYKIWEPERVCVSMLWKGNMVGIPKRPCREATHIYMHFLHSSRGKESQRNKSSHWI